MANTQNNDNFRDVVFLHDDFGAIMNRWAATSAQQLQDAFKMQKIYPVGEVWPGWFKENATRKKRTRNNPWYSTGHSFDLAKKVEVEGYRLPDLTVAFNTTVGMLYAEAGAGLTGNKHTRGKRARRGRKRIKIDRKMPYTHTENYAEKIGGWTPMRGRTHRPSVRQQANLLARRFKWLGKHIFAYKAEAFLSVAFFDLVNAGFAQLADMGMGRIVVTMADKDAAKNMAAWREAYEQ